MEKFLIISRVLVIYIGVCNLFGMDNYPNQSIEIKKQTLPFFITIYYHIEPNTQLFESVQPGYFETVSSCLRQMSSDLAAVNVHATFCFSWLYNDIVLQRNLDPNIGNIVNKNDDTGIETFEKIASDNHEIAYHSHQPIAVRHGYELYYARPNNECMYFDTKRIHRWKDPGSSYSMEFEPGVYQFNDSTDTWFGQFIWERTAESLYRISDYLDVTVRHLNGGQKPMLDLLNSFGFGINHPHCINQIRSMMMLGFDLIAPESIVFFNDDYSSSGTFWSDTTTFYVSYFGPDTNMQIYYPDIDRNRLEKPSHVCQGLTFMPVQIMGQVNWEGAGEHDTIYYDTAKEGGTGGGGVRWTNDTFYASYTGMSWNPFKSPGQIVNIPSLADQFNNAVKLHIKKTPDKVNAWGMNHHVVNVMWADLSGLSDNWDKEIDFLHDIADGIADGQVNPPRPDLVRFVTMQELSDIYDDVTTNVDKRNFLNLSQECFLFPNYPNPFNSKTTIIFRLNKSGKVSLKVYNLYGQGVANLVENTYMPGQYGIQFNSLSLPSGIYLYKIETEDFTSTRKLVIIK